MAYIPDANDASNPTDAIIAETAQAEFRAIKAKLNAMALASGTRIPVRQTILSGLTDAAIGAAAFLAISGTALGVDLKATASPAVLTWANGFAVNGAIDSQQVISNDLANNWPALSINNTSYLSVDYVDGIANPTPLATLAPPQYGPVYDRTRQSVLQYAGAAGATTFLDDFGNTWVAQGGAKVQTNAFKFGTGGLGGGGALNVMNGTTDSLKSTSFNFISGRDGWSIRSWVQPSALPGAAARHHIAGFVSTVNQFGVQLFIYNNAGTIRFAYSLSSANAAFDIAADQQGTTLPVVGTWYFVELTYDALAGVYRLYVNGAQEASTASALKLMGALNVATIGIRGDNTAATAFNGYMDKFEMLPYCQHPNGTAYAVPTGAPDVTVRGYSADWFDTNNYKMFQVTAASAAAAANPTFTAKNRLYLGEADTSGVAVTAVRAYAIQGRYVGQWITPTPAAGVAVSKNHNIGTQMFDGKLEIQHLLAFLGSTCGDIIENIAGANATYEYPLTIVKGRNTILFTGASTTAFTFQNPTTGQDTGYNSSINSQYRVKAVRSF